MAVSTRWWMTSTLGRAALAATGAAAVVDARGGRRPVVEAGLGVGDGPDLGINVSKMVLILNPKLW
jgi:hypothetical protein